ncbi:MAG TPA: NAD(P)/FAD-dependent oxidoreductase [Gammaproteobacteria bacterium]|nr:NAD(P)/FAD-dependent oxidoreductase [Gammaproteobacteria bacterium]
MTVTQGKVTLIGAGLAGSLLAVFLARRGFAVEVYERLPDMRRHAIPAGRSINLALAHRGIRALEAVGLYEEVQRLLIPMRGRMLHDLDGGTSLALYGRAPTEVIHSVSRPGLNMLLMDAAERAGARIHFGRRCEDVDFDSGELTLVDEAGKRESIRAAAVIATDGGGSAVRQALMKRCGVQVREDILPHAYKELTIPAGAGARHRMEKEALHIWPRGGYMLIALPNLDGSFTVTLFLAREGDPSFAALEDPEALQRFFASQFPDALALITDLAKEFYAHPTGLMGTVHTASWHADGRALLLGDAAHAIVPFHGQGMNCALEDCLALDGCLDRHGSDWEKAFLEFEAQRRPDAEAIAAMALENYVEMRDAVRDPRFQLQKQLGFLLEERHPGVFVPRYSMVMFHHLPYSEARRRGSIQQRILDALTEQATDVKGIDLAHADAMIGAELGHLERVR